MNVCLLHYIFPSSLTGSLPVELISEQQHGGCSMTFDCKTQRDKHRHTHRFINYTKTFDGINAVRHLCGATSSYYRDKCNKN
jgi:hypothetical protein